VNEGWRWWRESREGQFTVAQRTVAALVSFQTR
jgi:hypothetical protein